MKDRTQIKEKADRLIEMTSGFCDSYLDDDYRKLCEKLVQKMSRKHNVPFLRGREEIWAAAVIHSLGSINFLFDSSFEPYVSATDICDHFNTSTSTVSQKSRVIRDMFDMGYWDEDFSTKRMKEKDPIAEITSAMLGLPISSKRMVSKGPEVGMKSCEDGKKQKTLYDRFEDEEEGTIINLKCKKCKKTFDCDVGKVTFPSRDEGMGLEKDIICPNCGIRTMGQVDPTDLGISQLVEVFLSTGSLELDEREYSDDDLDEICDMVYDWGIEFSESKYYSRLTEEQKKQSEGVIMFLAEYMYNYYLLWPDEWDEDTVEDCCIDILPSKISAKEPFFRSISPVLTVFFEFLAQRGLIDNAKELAKRVRGLEKEIVKNASDPENWGIAKTMVMDAMEAGVDVSNKKELDKFVEDYNRGINDGSIRLGPVKSGPKVGRNDPCPCGSGKKYKKCCINKDTTAEGFPEGYTGDPVIDFEGFSPNEMQFLLYDSFNERSPMTLGTKLDSLEDAMIYRNVLGYLDLLKVESPLKLTVKGNLPVKFCKLLLERNIAEESSWIFDHRTINREEESGYIHFLNRFTRSMGLVSKRHGKLSLTKKGSKYLQEDCGVELYHDMFKSFVQNFNWGYSDYMEDSWIVQGGFTYSLFLLQKYGEKPRDPKFYIDKYLIAFPSALNDFPKNSYETPKKQFSGCYETRVCKRFLARFGLAEIRYKDDNFYGPMTIKKTKLLDEFIQWKRDVFSFKR